MGKCEPVTITAKGMYLGKNMTVIWKRDENSNTDVTFDGQHDQKLETRFNELLKRRRYGGCWLHLIPSDFAYKNTAWNVREMLKERWFAWIDYDYGRVRVDYDVKVTVEGKLEDLPHIEYEYNPNVLY